MADPTFVQSVQSMNRRKALASALMGAEKVQPTNMGQGLAKALLMGLGGYQQGQLTSDQNNLMQQALSGGITSPDLGKGMALSQVPGMEKAGEAMMTASMKEPNADEKAINIQSQMLQGQAVTPQDKSWLDAYKQMKSAQIGQDVNGNLYRKYDFGAQVAPQTPTGNPQASTNPQVSVDNLPALQASNGQNPMLMPPVSGSGQPDMSLFQGVQQGQPTLQAPNGYNPKTPKGMGAMDSEMGQQAAKTQFAGPQKFQEGVGSNLADKAVPQSANDNVPKLTNSLTLIQDMQNLNKDAYDGYWKGPASQMAGRVLGDNFLPPDVQNSRNAYSNFEQKATMLQAEMLKPTVGGNQISNADVQFVAKASSVLPTASRQEREQILQGLAEVAQRKRDIEAIEQAAAQQGRTIGPQDIAQYYASRGINYQTGERVGQVQEQSVQAPPEIIKQAGEGGVISGPDGKHYVVRGGKLVPQ